MRRCASGGREQTANFAAEYAWRAGVEGTAAQGVRSSELRRTPYAVLRAGEDAPCSPDDGGDEPRPVATAAGGRTEGADATRRLCAIAPTDALTELR